MQTKAKNFDACGIQVIAMANAFGKVDLPSLFSYLAKEREMNEIHVESGFKLNGSMLREDCVDELLLYYAPFLMGEGIGMANVGLMNSFDYNQAQTLLVNAQSEVLRTKYDSIFKIKILEFYFGIPIIKN
jgi:diaminohydroxyphosphoribosylaminopyrimidine deaminase/5-amino-6-(5-phosphoribosylamino)uracil reductase